MEKEMKITRQQILKEMKDKFVKIEKKDLIDIWLIGFYEDMEDRKLLAIYTDMFDKEYQPFEVV